MLSPFSSGLSMLVSKCGKARPTLPCLVPGPGRLEDCGPVVSVEPWYRKQNYYQVTTPDMI